MNTLAAMVASMKPGSVIVDLAVERGGNVEGAKAGEVATTAHGVKIVGHLNVAGRIAASASLLYAKNLLAFLESMVDKDSKTVRVNPDDELQKATMLTHGGKVVHPAFANAAAPEPKPIVPGQNRGDDPATGPATDRRVAKAAKGTEPGLDVAPKKAARKPAAKKPAAKKGEA